MYVCMYIIANLHFNRIFDNNVFVAIFAPMC